MEPEKFPTVSEVKKSIERLNQKEFPKYEQESDVEDYVKKVTDEIFNEFDPMLNVKQPMKCNSSFCDFYRVRPLDTFSNINLIREHSYPPLDLVGMGRCNFPKLPVFYCSNNIGTSLFEVVKNINDNSRKYCVSKWELIPSEEDLFFESFLQVPLPPENYFNILKDGFSKKLSRPFEQSYNTELKKEQQEGMLEYFKYLDSCFIKDDDYSISATLAHRTLYAKHNLRTDILMYPSVQTKFTGVNFAIHPNFVENNMKLSRLYILNFEKHSTKEGLMNITFSKYAEVEKSVLIWKSINPKNEEHKKIIREDFGEMINLVSKNINKAVKST